MSSSYGPAHLSSIQRERVVRTPHSTNTGGFERRVVRVGLAFAQGGPCLSEIDPVLQLI